ncbi:MAG: hypothetical protein Q9186_003727 [Xanthomendoza sp. 1 TL-2023]
MDPVTAFSLAAAVIQVVDFSTRVLGQCRELHKNGSLAEHRDSAEVADELEDLLAELSKLTTDQGGWREASKKGFRALRRRQWLKEKQEKLDTFEKVLDTRILVQLNIQSLKDAHQLEHLEGNVKKLALGLENGCNTVEKLLQAQSRQLINHVDRKFDDQERVRANRQRQERFLESLYFPEILSREEQIPDAFEGTCEWIFHSQDETGRYQPWANFRLWLGEGTGAYWISGKPGAGKSTLMKYIVGDERTKELLEAWKGQNELLLVSFFFWSTGSDLQKSSTGLLRSILYQIAARWPTLMDLGILDNARQSEPSGAYGSLNTLAAWTDRRLLSTLKLMLDRRPVSAYLCIFVDGLDEFVGEEDLLLDIIRLFVSTPRLKVCVSSRPEEAFREEFRHCCQLRVQDLNRNDFKAIIQNKLIPTISQWMHPEDNQGKALEDLLMEKAQGVWLWLDLMIKDLIKGARDGDTFDELQARLKRTPSTIKGLYAQKLQALDPSYLEEAIGYFQVLIVRNVYLRMVSVTILQLILAEEEWWRSIVDHNLSRFQNDAFDSSCRRFEKRLMSRCAGLMEVQDVDFEKDVDFENESVVSRHDRTVNFIHRTVEEYLHEEHAVFFQRSSWYSKATIKLARGCLGLAFLRSDPPLRGTDLKIPYQLIGDTMYTLTTLGYSQTNHDFEDELKLVQIDLVNQVIRTIQHIYVARGGQKKTFFDNEMLLSEILDPRWSIHDPRFGFLKGDLSFAAYFGCSEFVKSHLSKLTMFDESLVDVVLEAIDAKLHKQPTTIHCVAYFMILSNLSDRGFDPNHMLEDFGGNQNTRWGLFFKDAMELACDMFSSRPASHQEQSLWMETCNEIVTRFLCLGANPEGVIRSREILFWTNGAIVFTLEESPLCFFDRLPAEVTSRLRGIKESLLSAGVERYRRFSTIKIRGGYRGYKKYRISSAQSQQLNDSMYPDSNEREEPAWLKLEDKNGIKNLSPSVERFLMNFVTNLSEEDRIHYDVSEREEFTDGLSIDDEHVVGQ